MRNLAAFFSGLFSMIIMCGYAASSHNQGEIRTVDAAPCAYAKFNGYERQRSSFLSDFFLGKKRVDCSESTASAQVQEPSMPLSVAASRETLMQARKGFVTKFSVRSKAQAPLPEPPPELFVRSDYRSGSADLPAFVTNDPNDGLRHPAIIWLMDGDTNTLAEFWKQSADSGDGSASAFRIAGVVTMFPVLRGGNTDASSKEYFLGEVDDVVAAAEHLAQLRYVDPDRIFLGGYGTGGTLALLIAESSSRFAGVFSFGPVAEIDRYVPSIVPVDFSKQQVRERRLRSPIHWLHGIVTPTYLIEGADSSEHAGDFESLCKASENARINCIPIDGADRLGTLGKVSTAIAARVAISDSREFSLRSDEFSARLSN